MKTEERIAFRDYDIVRYPITTEKSTRIGENDQYLFVVDKKASKSDIKRAVERIFEVKVKAVNTLIRKGKRKSFKGRVGVLSDLKRAFVRLEKGHSINFTSGV
ncbi:MAG: 50S ribosomal protein L23 [Holosporales bacterium]|jgi:large subunit ribosomal protein L23|nr:50S ribosomal protein L23 [Holosporales bacterium]